MPSVNAAADEASSLSHASASTDHGTGGPERSTSNILRRMLLDNDKALAYTFLTTLSTVPTLLFASLHMAAFLKMHSISASQVAAAHIVYVVWDTTNNLFAGYISDAYATRYGTRLGFVCVVQALWVLTTFTPFLRVPQSLTLGISGTLYYLMCISIYSGCASMVGAARGALMAEITRTEGECIHLKRLNSVLGCVETVANLAGYALWNPAAPAAFLSYLSCITLVAICINFLSANHLRPYTVPIDKQASADLPPLGAVLRSLSTNAWVYIAMMALHEFQGVIWSQFGVVVMETAFASSPKFWRVSFMGVLSAAGGVTVFLVTWVADRIGVYRVLLWTFRVKALGAILLVALGALLGFQDYLVGLGMLLIEVSCSIFAGFQMLVMVNLINELASARRTDGTQHPLFGYSRECGPALLMGMSSCFVKPFNSLGTVVGTAVLVGPAAVSDRARDFLLLASVLLAVGLAQWALWGHLFSLHHWMSSDARSPGEIAGGA